MRQNGCGEIDRKLVTVTLSRNEGNSSRVELERELDRLKSGRLGGKVCRVG